MLSSRDLYKVSPHQPFSSLAKAVPAVRAAGYECGG